MARIAGITLPPEKRVEWDSPTSMGWALQVEPDPPGARSTGTRRSRLLEDEVNKIRQIIEKREKIEGDLRKEISTTSSG